MSERRTLTKKIKFFYRDESSNNILRSKELVTDFRCDLFVENCLVVELKTVSEINSIYQAQLLTYMKLLKAPKGIIINFNCFNIFKEGQKTFVSEYFRSLPKL